MNPAHQRGQASTSSVRSFDESNEHATDYISGMYTEPLSLEQERQRPRLSPSIHHAPSPPRKKVVPPPPPPKENTIPSATNSSYSNSSIQSTPSQSMYQPSLSSESGPPSPEQRQSPTLTRPRLRPPSPPPQLSSQMPLSGLGGDGDESSPSSPAEIAKELSNLQAFKRMSLDASNLVSDPDLPSNRMSVPDFTDLMDAGVDQDAARLLWVPGLPHLLLYANSSPFAS